jgi:predicted ATP-grasp superfamily ATP-dependent carboligase
VSDAGRGSAVATIRSLARHGYEVIAADADRRSPGLASRYAKHRIVYACPKTNPRQFIRDIMAAVDQYQVDLIVPVTELVILPLEAAREQIQRVCKVALPPTESVATVRDKNLTFQLAEKLNIPFPRTSLVYTVDEALNHAPNLGWPLVLKPSSSHTVTDDSAIRSWSVTYAHDEMDLREKMQQFEGRCPVLLQEYFAGAGVGVEVLAHAGKPICAFQHRRIREVPLTGGVSSLRRSDPLDPQLYAHTLDLIKALNWTGLAMAEFKLNERGDSRLMEINGRIWGSLPVAISAGVNFPVRLCELYLQGPPDESVPVQTAYRTGVHVHNFHKELSWIYRVLRGAPPHPVMKLPKRRAAFRAVFDLLNPRYRFDILSLGDPMPGIRLVSNLTRSAWQSVASRFRSDANSNDHRDPALPQKIADNRPGPAQLRVPARRAKSVIE